MSIKLSIPNYDDIVNKEKIKNLKINIDEVNKIANKNNIIHKKIQLWTNDKGVPRSRKVQRTQLEVLAKDYKI